METEEPGRDEPAATPADQDENDAAASDALDKEPDYQPEDEELKDLKGG